MYRKPPQIIKIVIEKNLSQNKKTIPKVQEIPTVTMRNQIV
jgi:hypothetical protein